MLLECLVGLLHNALWPFSDILADYAVFALPDFDPNDYANAILAGEPYPPQPGKNKPAKSTGLAPASEDVSVAISKLTYSLDDVEKQLKNVVSTPLPPACTNGQYEDPLSLRTARAWTVAVRGTYAVRP